MCWVILTSLGNSDRQMEIKVVIAVVIVITLKKV